MKLLIKCKLTKLTSDPWEKLEDFSNVYKGSMGKPYVSNNTCIYNIYDSNMNSGYFVSIPEEKEEKI